MFKHVNFYDIESLDNTFTVCNFDPRANTLDVFVLLDGDLYTEYENTPDFMSKLSTHIYAKNTNFVNGHISYYDLTKKTSVEKLAKLFGVSTAISVNNIHDNTSQYDKKYRPVCDTDPQYNEDDYPFFMGYNSYNYDTTMLAHYFYEAFENDDYTYSAKKMREFNNELFEPRYINNMPSRLAYQFADDPEYNVNYQNPKYLIRKNMLLSGRHLDVSRLNEKMHKVGLKRLLGMLGYQILESDKLSGTNCTIKNINELFELIAYNASDVINLHELLKHPFYTAKFTEKQTLLETYPELKYKKDPVKYEPDKSFISVRRDRLTIDSSSARFVSTALCPYGYLKDEEAVSFVYPSDLVKKQLEAKGKTVKQVDVLDDAKRFFYKHFSPYPDAIAAFDKIYDYYDSIRGKNFNHSEQYRLDYKTDDELPKHLEPYNLSDIPKTENNMFYYNADGSPSSCFVTFSTGGIHGAEYNKALYEADVREWEDFSKLMGEVKRIYPDPLELRRAKTVILNDIEYKYSQFLRSGITIKAMEAMTLTERQNTCWRNPDATKPVLFKPLDNGNTKLNPKYVYTSYGYMNHEDFESYYPNLLRHLGTFYNKELGYDRYGEIFEQKQFFGKMMKDKSLSEEERTYYANRREGTKLLLNTASGAADTDYGLPIQMNNYIISMRIIGQLFTWRIGQAQTLAGAKIPSTNTDGLYTVMEENINNQILAKEAADIGITITPERVFLISKDSNNRLEINTENKISTSGGTLACFHDIDPTKSLAHPAVIDWALGQYLIHCTSSKHGLSEPFDEEMGMKLLTHARDSDLFDPVHKLRMFQNVIASSPGKYTYIFGFTSDEPRFPDISILQHYNRVFIMKPNTQNTMHLKAATARVLTPAMQKRLPQNDPIAKKILKENGIESWPHDRYATLKVVTHIDPTWDMLIYNKSLYDMPLSTYTDIINNLNLEAYLSLLKHNFEKNWRNISS